jgi:hypothetical protein
MNGWLGCEDGIGHAAEGVFDKMQSLAILFLRQEKSAALLLHYTLQMRASECN